MRNFDHENSHRHEFTSKVRPPKNNTVPEDIRECISMTIFVKFWQYLGEQASDRQLPVNRICKQTEL